MAVVCGLRDGTGRRGTGRWDRTGRRETRDLLVIVSLLFIPKAGGNNEAVRNSQSMFDPTGDLFYPSLYACVILIIVIVALGMMAEFLYFRPSKCVRRQQSHDLGNQFELEELNKKNGMSSSSSELDKQMMEEIQAIFKKYQQKKSGINPSAQDS